MASKFTLFNANGNTVTLLNPDSLTEDIIVDLSKIGEGLGVAQTWQDMSASRIAGVTYTNNTGKPIEVQITKGDSSQIYITVDGLAVGHARAYSSNDFSNFSITVPNGSTYSVNTFSYWKELRD